MEGFGIAILEANALGIPAIGAKNCGIEDAISDNESGILILNSSSDDFLKAIDKIYSNYSKFSLKSKQWAEKHTWNKIVSRYIEIIEQ